MKTSDEPSSSRRDFVVTLGLAAASAAVPRSALAESRWTRRMLVGMADGPVQQIRKAALTDPMPVQTLRGGLSVISGSGGNITVLAHKDGTVLVDSGIVGSRVSAVVGTITPTPVKVLINSHWHFDHTDANEWHASRGAHLIAQDNTRKHLLVDTRVVDWDFTFPAAAKVAVPTDLFAQNKVLHFGDTTVRLDKYAPAHTDADIAIHFENQDVLHVADTWWNGMYPFIDYSTGGSIDGMIAAVERNLARTTDSTVIVPGHGSVGNRAQLAQWHGMLVGVRDNVARLKKQGRSVEDTVKARPTVAFDSKWDQTIINGDFLTRLVYKGV